MPLLDNKDKADFIGRFFLTFRCLNSEMFIFFLDTIKKFQQIVIDLFFLISQTFEIIFQIFPILIVLQIFLFVSFEGYHFSRIASDELNHWTVFNTVEPRMLIEEVGLLQGLKYMDLVSLKESTASDCFVLLTKGIKCDLIFITAGSLSILQNAG